MPVLREETVDQLLNTTIDHGLDRDILAAGINRRYWASLPTHRRQSDQFISDLHHLNEVGELMDGSWPLQIWLNNGRRRLLLELSKDARVFVDALDEGFGKADRPKDLSKSVQDGIVRYVTEMAVELPKEERSEQLAFAIERWLEADAIVKLAAALPAVCSVTAHFPDGVAAHGTGFLIAPDHVLTCRHNLYALDKEGNEGAYATDVEVSFGVDATGHKPSGPISGRFGDIHAVKHDETGRVMDWAVIPLAEPEKNRPVLSLGSKQIPRRGAPALIIGHPYGLGAKVALDWHGIREVTDTDIKYVVDTATGSSGSPVLNQFMQVIGLHRAADLREVAKLRLGEHTITAKQNIGTNIHAIIGGLEAANVPFARTV